MSFDVFENWNNFWDLPKRPVKMYVIKCFLFFLELLQQCHNQNLYFTVQAFCSKFCNMQPVVLFSNV